MYSFGPNFNDDFHDLFEKVLGSHGEYTGASTAIKRLENDLKGMNRAINNLLAEALGLEKTYNMYIEINFKSNKEKEILSIKDAKWSTVISTIEEWVNDPEKCDFADDIKYICIKADQIKYYQVNTIIKNLTKKVTLIRMKEKPI
jgi:hypothetical protein